MNHILTSIVCLEMFADDLHYRSTGEAFYGLHLLADRIKDGYKGKIDELRECYYIGELATLPPKTSSTYSDAITMYNHEIEDNAEDGNKIALLRVHKSATYLLNLIEQFKRDNEGLTSGTIAILDSISTATLTAIALVERSMR